MAKQADIVRKYLKEIGKKGGSAGRGPSKARGLDHYRENQRKGAETKRKRREEREREKAMTTRRYHIPLSTGWELTTDHAASSNGQPVLVRLETGEAYGPCDVIQVEKRRGFESPLMPAAAAATKMAAGSTAAALDEVGKSALEKFVAGCPAVSGNG